MTFLHGMRRLASKVGVDVQRRTPMTMPFLRLVETLRQRGVRTVIDVGANNGGYAADLLEAGFDGHVVSFEPLPAEWRALRDRASKWNGRWTVGDCVALSDRHGEASFHVASNSVSSSLLSMGPRHEAAAPASAIRNVITVRTERLDDIVGTMDLQGPVFLKIDVQGAEHLVLVPRITDWQSKV